MSLYIYIFIITEFLLFQSTNAKTKSEEIPDPSPLVVPGYNLPENIFNRGKPFYVEKDPLTGKIDFSQKSPSVRLDEDLYDYVDEPQSDDIYDKSNINRKDGSLHSHKPSDVNQLTPNFHDFLNLPVKYNPDKYVAPLISSSYSSTKIQGSVNKLHNHKDYIFKPTSYKPTVSPTYFSTNQYFSKAHTTTTSTTTTTTTTKPTTIRQYPEMSITTGKPTNIMNSGMAHPSFSEEFEDEYYDEPSPTEKQPISSKVFLTTGTTKVVYHSSKAPPTSIYQTAVTTPTTTKKTMSIFDQLFGDYDEVLTTTETTTKVNPKPPPRPPSLFNNLPENKNNYKIREDKTEKPRTTSSSTTISTSSPTNSLSNNDNSMNVLSGTHIGIDHNYEYDYENEKYEDNVAVENKPFNSIAEDDLAIEPLHSNNNNEVKTTTTTSTSSPELTTFKHAEQNNNINKEGNKDEFNEYDYMEKDFAPITATTTITTTTTTRSVTPASLPTTTTSTQNSETLRVTSLPLGDNHITSNKHEPFNRDPIIVATQNLREKLNNEKVMPKPFEKPQPIRGNLPPSTSNIHISHDQDTVSFVVGNHQSVGDNQYMGSAVGTALKESPYDSNPFRPLYGHQATYSNDNSVSYSIQANPQATFNFVPHQQPKPSFHEVVGSAVTIQPLRNSEASLAIGMPINSIQRKPGQVMDEKLEVEKETKVEEPSSTPGSKIVFPDENDSELPGLIPPPERHPVEAIAPSNDILNFNSKPMYHQLPSDLTPPKEQDEIISPSRTDYNRPFVRPPWDPRPGHFHSGKPEYNRPPRPNLAFKRIDHLPNILPQFRPNMKKNFVHPGQFMRQPLLDRPSNRPIGFLEKLQPPPPPQYPATRPQNIQLRNPASPPPQSLEPLNVAQDRIMNEEPRRPTPPQDPFGFYQTPPQIKIPNRRNGDDDLEVETLQMIQAKKATKRDDIIEKDIPQPHKVMQVVNIPSEEIVKDNTEKSIYKVYPVNTPPIKLDVIDNDKKEAVVIGTRAELPLPPSKISGDFIYDQNPLFDSKERNDAPILKPHPRPPTYSIKTDIPYPLERPDSSLNHPAVPETPTKNGNDLGDLTHFNEHQFFGGNQWNTYGENLESRIVTGQKVHAPSSNQISAILKTYTEKPIAIAYTPTEPYLNADKYSMPNYGSPVIPEIRPNNKEHNDGNKEFTVSAIMHTHPQKPNMGMVETIRRESNEPLNHKVNVDEPNYPKLDFEAPFHASVNLDHSINQGWAVVRDKNKTITEVSESTTIAYATTSEFDIENFKPQLEGGFKPIYSFPDDKTAELRVNERQE